MTNLEYYRTCTKEQLAVELCNLVDSYGGSCGNCIAQEYCYPGHNGFLTWLDKDVEENE